MIGVEAEFRLGEGTAGHRGGGGRRQFRRATSSGRIGRARFC